MIHAQLPGKKTLPELLAPAGSSDAFFAAVAAGADAVYLAGTQFGARKFARNFSVTEIEDAVRYAHARAVRVYVTVNTLVHDTELAPVAEYLVWLYSIGVDAILVQDIGVASVVREIVPDLPVHASTQLTIHSADGVRWAADQGFSRVVLARELPLPEVRAIARAIGSHGIGLEVFVHGALCYCYSGQCLLSSVIGGRSGNRGRCAQPCRKPYELVTGEPDEYGRLINIRTVPLANHFLLSPRDLCTYQNLPELVNSPVASLKIEGRMKSPEYVAVVVSIYRRALDAIAKGDWEPDMKDWQDLLLAFNRGFTGGYLFNYHHADLMGRERPDNRGLCIGSVTQWDDRGRRVSVRCEIPVSLHPGDGLLFSYPDNPDADWGFSLNNEPVRGKESITFTVPRQVRPGARVFITASGTLLARARQIMSRSPADLRHPVPLDLAVRIAPDGALTLAGTIHTGAKKPIFIQRSTDLRLVPAHSRPLSRDHLAAQLKKTGGTPFVIRKFLLEYTGGMFAPVAKLNRVRREFLAYAEETLVGAAIPAPDKCAAARSRLLTITHSFPENSGENLAYTLAKPEKNPGNNPTKVSLAIFTDRIESVRAAISAGADVCCFEPDFSPEWRGGGAGIPLASVAAQLREALTLSHDTRIRMVWKLPRITRQNMLDAVLPVITELTNEGLDECMVDGTGAFYAIFSHVPGMHLSGSAGMNITNHRSVLALANPPFRMLTLSPELSKKEIALLVAAARRAGSTTELAVIVQGTVETIISEDCLLEPVRKCRCASQPDAQMDPAVYGIRDETGHIFPVRVDAECRTHIGNAVETTLLNHLPGLIKAGIRSFVIDARGRTPRYTGEMTAIYRDAIALGYHPDGDTPRRLTALKERVRRCAWGGLTAGPLLHGLKEE
jgi:U32 family peptidase